MSNLGGGGGGGGEREGRRNAVVNHFVCVIKNS